MAWNSRKQAVQALSTCEAKYIAGTNAVQHTMWFRRSLAFIPIPAPPITVYLDNISAVRIAKKTACTKRRKFIDVKHHYLREYLKRNNIIIHHIPTAAMLTDICTKTLRKTKFTQVRSKLRMG